MVKVIVGIFLALHGLVHLLYFGQSVRLFELKPGMTWPEAAWAFSKLLGDSGTRTLASLMCILAAAGFVIGSAGVLFGQAWWQTAAVAAAGLSGVLYILFWNGRMQNLDGQGVVAILIDAAILAAVLIFHWPKIGA